MKRLGGGAFVAHVVRIETKWTTKEAEQHVVNKTSSGILLQAAILNNTYGVVHTVMYYCVLTRSNVRWSARDRVGTGLFFPERLL